MSDWSADAVEYVQAIADTKLIIGHRAAQWSLAGPTLEDDIGGASTAQEETGHVRQLFRVLERQGRDAEWLNGEREPEEFRNAASLDEIGGGWTAYVASTGPADRAAWYMLDAVTDEDMQGMITKIGEEEYFHLDYHDARLETLADSNTDELQAAIVSSLEDALAFIGPADYDEDGDPLYESGFTDRPVSELRTAFVEHYEALFEGTPISLDDLDTSVPDADEWDEVRRRVGGGSIGEEDVEQLRGTKNAMFARN